MLPKLQHPTFDVIIPSTKVKYQFRPYTVKEQKILLLMQEIESVEELAGLIIQLIDSCAVSTNFSTKKLTYFDIEYIFLKIRTKSVGDDTTISFRCNNTVDGEVCGETNLLKVRLDDIEVDFTGSTSNQIQINPTTFLHMNYPSVDSAQSLEKYNTTKDLKMLFDAIVYDLDHIIADGKVYDDFSGEELEEFLNSLDIQSFKAILDFYINTPKLKKILNFTCKKCQYNDVIVLSGLIDFFV
jgi:hypothetical protein